MIEPFPETVDSRPEEMLYCKKIGKRMFFMTPGIRICFNDGSILYLNKDHLTAGEDGVYTGTYRGVSIVWRLVPVAGGFGAELEISSEKPLNVCRMDSIVLDIGKQERPVRYGFYTNSFAYGETRYPDEVGIDREYVADGVGVYKNFCTPGVTVCGLAPFRNLCGAGVVTRLSGDVELFVKTEFTVEASRSKRLVSEKAYYLEGLTAEEFGDWYRNLLPQSSFPMPKLTGWNTWDYYLDRVTPEDVLENLAALEKMPFRDRLDYVVIDDGWQKEWGVWTENGKFSCGIASLAEAINKAGFKAGIWMAPLAVRKEDSLWRSHPEWFCKEPDGSFFSDGMYYLDPTHPEAREYILDHYRYQYRAGYRLFKIDYLSPLLKVKTFHDPEAAPYSALQNLMEDVRRVTGEDVVILGCSLPVQCGADVAPSMRIGVDIHNHWDHVYWIADSLKYTWAYNGRVTRIDPDFMVVRGAETADEELIWEGGYNGFIPPARALESESECFKRHWRHGDQFNSLEAETWANLVAVCGGNIFLSDRLSVLNERGVEILKNALSVAGELGRPRYLVTDDRRPSVWESERSMVVINWSDEAATLTVPGVKHSLESRKPFALSEGTLTVTLAPHESFAALFTE